MAQFPKIFIKSYRIPIERVGESIQEKMVELTPELLIKEEEKELDPQKTIQSNITEMANEVAKQNNLQVKIVEQDKSRDYIIKKILTKV